MYLDALARFCLRQVASNFCRIGYRVWLRVLILGTLTAATLISCGYASQTLALDYPNRLQPHDVTAEAVTYHGRKAARVTPADAADTATVRAKNREGGGIIGLLGTALHNGTIEVGWPANYAGRCGSWCIGS